MGHGNSTGSDLNDFVGQKNKDVTNGCRRCGNKFAASTVNENQVQAEPEVAELKMLR